MGIYFMSMLNAALMPFNCTNPRSVVVMDNASIHHVDKVVALIEEVGTIVIYLPPYSPDIMPIEECFSKVKAYLRANPLLQILDNSEIEDAILLLLLVLHQLTAMDGSKIVDTYTGLNIKQNCT